MAQYVFLVRHDASARHFHVTWRYVDSGSTWRVGTEDSADNAFISANGRVRIGDGWIELLGPNLQVYARLHLPSSGEGFDDMDIATIGNITHMLTRGGFPSAGWKWILQERQPN